MANLTFLKALLCVVFLQNVSAGKSKQTIRHVTASLNRYYDVKNESLRFQPMLFVEPSLKLIICNENHVSFISIDR